MYKWAQLPNSNVSLKNFAKSWRIIDRKKLNIKCPKRLYISEPSVIEQLYCLGSILVESAPNIVGSFQQVTSSSLSGFNSRTKWEFKRNGINYSKDSNVDDDVRSNDVRSFKTMIKPWTIVGMEPPWLKCLSVKTEVGSSNPTDLNSWHFLSISFHSKIWGYYH